MVTSRPFFCEHCASICVGSVLYDVVLQDRLPANVRVPIQ
ncbi:hypothetical protein FHW02_002753 [Ochrobactrum sp. RH1CCR137]|nr:hypothetical protein [Ochrobactrum sp. RH1CCR137]MBA8856173.1 hypothetical protein [Ochrobactrum sp. RH1CCR134]